MIEIKSNLLTIAIITGFTILLGIFAFNFTTTTQDTAKTTIQEVNRTSDKVVLIIANLTAAVKDLTDLKAQELQTFRSGFFNLSNLITQQVQLVEEERNESKANLKLFMDTFANQSNTLVNTINDLNRDSNASREKQTQLFVETLGQSQNLTKDSQQLAQERNQIEKEQTDKVEKLITTLNLTLVPNATVTQ